MTEKPGLIFACLRKDTAEHYLVELQEIFQDEVFLSEYVFEDKDASLPDWPVTVVLAASSASYERCIGIFPREKLLLFNRDILFPYGLDRILLLPPGTKVLVVNELKDMAFEIIRQLRETGIDHLDYIPYWEGCDEDIRGVMFALSPGMFQHCPPEITERIDIKRRHMSVSTFIELLQRLGFDHTYVERLMKYHSSLLLRTYKRLSEQYAESLGLKKILESIVGNMSDAIICSEDGLVVECNHVAEKLFRVKRKYLLGKPLPGVLEGEYAGSGKSGDPYVLSINKAKYLCTRIDIAMHLGQTKDIHLYTLQAVSDLENLEARVRSLLYSHEYKAPKYNFSDIIAVSSPMVRAVETAREMALSPLSASILIIGESGTGKELFSQAIHNASSRSHHPFVAINFGAIPENLVESELFGYESGAFTGASKSGKKGLFEIARYGTILLDEIGDASPYIQARLLRVLEEKELMRLGGTKVIPVDVRIIAATNRDLIQMCRAGTFRIDLYHRLNTFPLKISPLRERPECLKAMLEFFQSSSVHRHVFSKEAMQCIYQYPWPGNARELKNMMDFLTLKSGADSIEVEDLPHDMQLAFIHTEAADLYERLMPVLSSYSSLQTIHALLSLIDTYTSRPLGRERLLQKLAEQGSIISDAKCRALIDHLARHNFVEKRKTKQGTIITGRGKTFMAYLRRRMEPGDKIYRS